MKRAATKHLAEADPVLGQLIKRVGPYKLKGRRRSPFHALAQAIIFQQLNGRAAETILGRFCALFGDEQFPTPKQVLAAPIDRLRTAGLSKPKAAYIRDLAERAERGLLPTLSECDALDDEEIIARLTEVKGVGRWTAEIFLMFNLGRPDVLPVLDYGLRRGFMLAYRKCRLPEPEALRRVGERWKPHRTVASWYLWRAADKGGA